jgi:hypothetical protein
MLKICPKCRRFYDDADLRFCLNDGVPLIFADEKLKPEGIAKIRVEKNLLRREMRLRQIKNVVSILVTTVLTIMIISVIVINTWLYLNPEEKDTAKIQNPTPTIEISPMPTIKNSISPAPQTKRTTVSANMNTNNPQICTDERKQEIKSQIGEQTMEQWRKSFLDEQKIFKDQNFDKLNPNCRANSSACVNFIIEIDDDCRTAIVNFDWQFIKPQKKDPNTKPIRYRKNANIWVRQ